MNITLSSVGPLHQPSTAWNSEMHAPLHTASKGTTAASCYVQHSCRAAAIPPTTQAELTVIEFNLLSVLFPAASKWKHLGWHLIIASTVTEIKKPHSDAGRDSFKLRDKMSYIHIFSICTSLIAFMSLRLSNTSGEHNMELSCAAVSDSTCMEFETT